MADESNEAGARPFPRRELFLGVSGLTVGAVAGWLAWGRSEPEDWPTAILDAGEVRSLVRVARRDGWVPFPSEGTPRIAIIVWDPSLAYGEGGTAADVYGEGDPLHGEGHPIVDDTTGLMVLSLRSTHLGCRVKRCESSKLIEDPCHGSSWNAWGEWMGGPARRGLDRYRSAIKDGHLKVNLTAFIVGRPREGRVFEQPSAGPNCIDQ
jgi:hypothetical protein